MNNKKAIKSICSLMLKYLNNKIDIRNINEFDMAELILNKENLKQNYSFYSSFNNFDIFLFKKDDKILLSIFDNNDINNVTFINRINLFYKICYKLFINVDFYKYFFKKDNISYHFLIDTEKTKISSVLLNKPLLSGDELVLFSIESYLLKEQDILKDLA